MIHNNSASSSRQEVPQTLSTGAVIGGRFEVLQLLRRDFVGTVYSARDNQSQRDVECLLISISAEDTHQLLDLRAHIHEAKKLRLKSFASTYGIGKQGGDGYVVRQRVEGRPLIDHLNHRSQNNRPFKQRGLCSLIVEVIQALEALRAQEIDINEHGLLRPNIIMIQNQQKPRVRMSDVGVGLIRSTLTKNPEYDPWTRGCIPELRKEKPPVDPDLYALGALLFQMTQLRPFTKGWLRELSVQPTFSQLPDLIEACTAEQPLITLQDLKSELKYAAQSQVESGGLTRDLSQLQERLQQIIQYETPASVNVQQEEASETSNMRSDLVSSTGEVPLAPEESVSVVFDQMPDPQSAEEVTDDVPLHVTPLPAEVYEPDDREKRVDSDQNSVAIPNQMSQLDSHQEIRLVVEESEAILTSTHVDQSHLPSGERITKELSPAAIASAADVQVDMSALNSMFEQAEEEEAVSEALPSYEEVKVQVSEPVISAISDSKKLDEVIDSLDEHIETLHGVDMEELGEEQQEFAAVRALYSNPDQFNLDIDRGDSVPQLPPPPPPSLHAVDEDINGQRWIVVRDGIDYGPFTLDELSHQLFREEIGLDTEICDIETDQRAPLGEFTSLDRVLNEWAKERLERKRRKEERAIRVKNRRRIMAVVFLAFFGIATFGGITYGPQLREAMLPEPANVDLASWLPPPPQMEKLTKLKESPAQRAERVRARRAEQARQETLRDAKAMAREAREASSAATVDFSRAGPAKRKRFSRAEFDKALASRSTQLMKCIEEEHVRMPDRKVLKVTLTVQQSGRFLNARLAKGTSSGVKCVFRAVRGLKMSPFSGGDKTITLPYRVK